MVTEALPFLIVLAEPAGFDDRPSYPFSTALLHDLGDRAGRGQDDGKVDRIGDLLDGSTNSPPEEDSTLEADEVNLARIVEFQEVTNDLFAQI